MGDLAPQFDIPTTVARLLGPAAIASLAGQHAVIAAFVTSAVVEFIPNRRLERIGTLFEKLAKRVETQSGKPLDAPALDGNDRVSLLEDGLWHAVRASSSDRLDYIACILANGLTAADAKVEDRRYLMRLLEELNDVEVLVLCAYARDSSAARAAFYEQHKAALDFEPACFGDSQDVIDRGAIRDSYEEHLVRLNLLQHSGGIEVNDHFRAHGGFRELTNLGRLLLREIGQMRNE